MIQIPRNILFSLTNKAVQYNFIFSAFVTDYVQCGNSTLVQSLQSFNYFDSNQFQSDKSIRWHDSKLTDDWFTKE